MEFQKDSTCDAFSHLWTKNVESVPMTLYVMTLHIGKSNS